MSWIGLLQCTGKYPLLDAATFRVRHVDLLIDSPTRYGQVDVSLRGWELGIAGLRLRTGNTGNPCCQVSKPRL